MSNGVSNLAHPKTNAQHTPQPRPKLAPMGLHLITYRQLHPFPDGCMGAKDPVIPSDVSHPALIQILWLHLQNRFPILLLLTAAAVPSPAAPVSHLGYCVCFLVCISTLGSFQSILTSATVMLFKASHIVFLSPQNSPVTSTQWKSKVFTVAAAANMNGPLVASLTHVSYCCSLPHAPPATPAP